MIKPETQHIPSPQEEIQSRLGRLQKWLVTAFVFLVFCVIVIKIIFL